MMPFLRRNLKHTILTVISIALPLLILFYSAPCFAGDPVGGTSSIYIYNVENQSFSVAWQVDKPSSCSVKLFNSGGTLLQVGIDYTVSVDPTNTPIARARGLMQVDVGGLNPDTTYLVQTVSSELDNPSNAYEFPPIGQLISVTTGKTDIAFSQQKTNGYFYLALYDKNGTGFPEQTQGVVAIIEAIGAGALSPISSANNGWPSDQSDAYAVLIDFSRLRTSTSYIDWTANPQNKAIKIICLGGLVPNAGLGQRIIETTYPHQNINTDLNYCLSEYGINDLNGCIADYIDQIILFPNKPPVFRIIPNTSYQSDIGSQLTIDVCAYDPEGDAFNIALNGEPQGMGISSTDPNCARITWTPQQGQGGFYKNIQVIAADASGSTPKTFNVIVFHGPPTTPTVSIIQPAALEGYTNVDLICNVDPNSVLNPDPANTTFIDYQWYDTNSTVATGNDIVVFNDTNVIITSRHQSTLSSTLTVKGKQYYCKVIAHDVDGSAAPALTSSVRIINSPPTAPVSLIDPNQPVPTDQDLVCRITNKASDIDGDPIQYQFVWAAIAGASGSFTKDFSFDTNSVLTNDKTSKGQTWKCTVTARDNDGATDSDDSSNTVGIKNIPPVTPSAAIISPTDPNTTSTLTCKVTPASPADADNDNVTYEYTWSCTSCGGKSPVLHPNKGTSDTLEASNTNKGEVWSCSVRAYDGTDYSSALQATPPTVTIQNSAPTNFQVEVKREGAAAVDPNGYVYIDQNIVCNVKTPLPTDPDSGDTITYTYYWFKNGSLNRTSAATTSASDALPRSELKRGDQWYCDANATDGTAFKGAHSNQVTVFNRAPSISLNPSTTQLWNEGAQYTIQATSTDPDGDPNAFSLDVNYTDPAESQVQGWVQFNAQTGTLTATPPSGSSKVNYGYGQGVLRFNFIVQDVMRSGDDPSKAKTASKLIEVHVQSPEMIIDNFEYQRTPAKPSLAANNWMKVQGNGLMNWKQSVLTDTNSNHYLQMTVSPAPTNNSQLNYIVTKYLDPEVFIYPELRFEIKDKNQFYFDAYVRASKGTAETNYFLRYVPVNPAGNYTVSGVFVIYNIGTNFIDSNGIAKKDFVRNMDDDLFKATGYHFNYLKSILLRGDIDYIDNIRLSQGLVDMTPPKEIKNLVADSGDKKVKLSWQLDPNQDTDIGGYNIYMNAVAPPTKTAGYLLTTVSSATTSYTVVKTVANADLVNGTTYNFLITAFDTSRNKNESAGVATSAIPGPKPIEAPVDVKATPTDRSIVISWKNPFGQSPDLYGYVIYYCNCTTDCGSCAKSDTVLANAADPNGRFNYTVYYDASGNRLSYGRYDFTVKARDNASPANYSSGVSVSATVTSPPSALIDNFEYASGQTLITNCWYRMQGSGAFALQTQGSNHYLKMVSAYTGANALGYIISKCIPNPEDYNNPELKMLIRSPGTFRVDLYILGSDNNYYFLSYKGDTTISTDTNVPVTEQLRWYSYRLGWKNYTSGQTWVEVKKNLDDDLARAVPGVHFVYLKGVLLRGTMDLDDMELIQGMAEVSNLTATPGNGTVTLSWSILDPSLIQRMNIYRNSAKIDSVNSVAGQTAYTYTATNLTNGTLYQFKVTQEIGTQESKGVTVESTPRDFKSMDTFDVVGEWESMPGFGAEVTPTIVYDTEIDSNVIRIAPTGADPERYSVTNRFSPAITPVTGITFRIKAVLNTNFVVWIELMDDTGLPFWLAFVPGASPYTTQSYISYGWFAYYFLGEGYTDGKWHYFDKNLDTILTAIIGTGARSINSVSIGGNLSADGLGFY